MRGKRALNSRAELGSGKQHEFSRLEVSDKDVKFAICNACRAEIPRGGSHQRHFNTTNMIRHLRTRHTTVIIRAVKVSALIYEINVAAFNALKYFNAVNATLFTSGVFPDTKPPCACSQSARRDRVEDGES